MFNLIIAIISIALVAVVVLAGIYYGGDMFTKQGTEVGASKILNEAAQVRGAVEMYRNDNAGRSPADLENDLVPKYLSTLPAGADGAWSVQGQYALTSLGPSTGGNATAIDSARKSCILVNEKLGLELGNTIPACSDSAYADVQLCCDDSL